MSDAGRATPRGAFWLVVSTLVGLHACMAATRVAATLAVLAQGFPEWTVGALLSLYGLAPIVISMGAGRMADRYGFHRPVRWAVCWPRWAWGWRCAKPAASRHLLRVERPGGRPL